ncbi:hypothetical protein C3943_08760 [Lysinibacillus sp. B2A1]|nr:hypothetical protein C3943_08760 [Lysinibacillus sp. B2A1]
MKMFINFIIGIIAVVLLVETYVIYSLIKLIKNFLTEIHSIKGIQFGTIAQGDLAPLFRAENQNKSRIVLKDILRNNEVTLLFLSNTCSQCQEVLKNSNEIFNDSTRYTIIIIQDQLKEEMFLNNEKISLIVAPDLFKNYKVTKTPYLYFVDKNGLVNFSTEISNPKHLKKLLVLEDAS